MEITERRVVSVEKGTVCYERVDVPWLVIYRTVAQHTEAVGKPPTIGDVVEFETWDDYCDGSISRYKGK